MCCHGNLFKDWWPGPGAAEDVVTVCDDKDKQEELDSHRTGRQQWEVGSDQQTSQYCWSCSIHVYSST